MSLAAAFDAWQRLSSILWISRDSLTSLREQTSSLATKTGYCYFIERVCILIAILYSVPTVIID